MSAPVDFVPWDRRSPLLDRFGDFRRHAHRRGTFGFLVDEPKLNARGFLHAGAIATIADACIGHSLQAETDPPTALVTVNLTMTLVGTANVDDWIEVAVRIDRVGRRLASGSAEFHRGTRAIATASAIFVPANPAPVT